jgi:hypothetical protein
MTTHAERDDIAEIAALEVNVRDRIGAAAGVLADQKAEIRVLTAILGERNSQIEELKTSLDARDKTFLSIQDELRTVLIAVRRDLQLKANLNRWLVRYALGLGLAGLGCCPEPWEMDGFSDHAKRAANSAWSCAVMEGGMVLLGAGPGLLLD